MSHTYTSLHYHIVFSTRDRHPWITPELRPRLHAYLGGILKNEKGALIAAGGVADHMHLLAILNETRSVSDTLRDLKANSSKWIHETVPGMAGFAWQEGYAAFSISHPGLAKVEAYIAGQEAHHRTVTFMDELRAFLDTHGIEYDERYLWD